MRLHRFSTRCSSPRRPRSTLLACEQMEARLLLTLNFSAVTAIGGNGTLQPEAVTVDAAGNSLVTGAYSGGTTLDATPAGQATGATDIFVAKFDPTGGLTWFRHYGNVGSGNSGNSQGFGVASDPAGDVFVTGSYSGKLDFDPIHPNLHTLSAFGRADGFLLKLDPNGNFGPTSYVLNAQGGNGTVNRGLAVAASADGTATITGVFQQSLNIGGIVLSGAGGQDAFVSRVTPTGSVSWADDFKSTAGVIGTQGAAVALDASGNAYVGGEYIGTVTFAPGVTLTSTKAGLSPSSIDAFVAKLDPAGNLAYVRGFGGPSTDGATAIAADAVGNVVVVGRYMGSAVFDPATISTAAGDGVFLARLTPAGIVASAIDLGISNPDTTFSNDPSVALDATGDAYVAASFVGTGNVGGTVVTSAGATDVLIVRSTLSGTLGPVLTAGGAGADVPSSIAINSKGKIVVFGSATTPAAFGALTLTSASPANLFLAQLTDSSPTGSGGGGGGGGSTTPRKPLGDFDGDGKTDLAVFNPATATFYVQPSGGGAKIIQQFGIPNGKGQPIAGDFDGDGKTDFAFFDPTTATYYIRYSNPAYNNGSKVQQFGIPNGKGQFVAGDYSGSGKADEAVFDPVSATYFIRYSNPSYNGGSVVKQFGIPNGKNQFVVGDFSGSGKDDEAVYDPVSATYYIRYANPAFNGGSKVQQFGIPNHGDVMLSGDYDGDGKTDIAVYDPPTSTFYIQYSSGGSLVMSFGSGSGRDTAIPASVNPNIASLSILSLAGASTAASTDFVALPTGAETSDMIPHARAKHAARDVALHMFGSGR